VCTENLIRIDKRLTSARDDHAVMAFPDPVHLAVQVEESACGRERGAPASAERIAAEGARSRPAHEQHRLFLVLLYRWCPAVLKAITVIRPETLVRWHWTGFRHYWRWKSRSFGGRPQIAAELRVSPYTSCEGEDGRGERNEDDLHHLNHQRGILGVALSNSRFCYGGVTQFTVQIKSPGGGYARKGRPRRRGF
jgi:hypothetical protein